jgi:hypothetical protein
LCLYWSCPACLSTNYFKSFIDKLRKNIKCNSTSKDVTRRRKTAIDWIENVLENKNPIVDYNFLKYYNNILKLTIFRKIILKLHSILDDVGKT